MCTVFVLDRFESASVGWPPAIAEVDIRLLLPCEDRLYENGLCAPGDNPLWWPSSIEGNDEGVGMAPKSEAGIFENEQHSRLLGEFFDGPLGGNGHNRPGPLVDSFAWLVRVVWIGGRIQAETYRSSGE